MASEGAESETERPTLTYFACRGRGEGARLALEMWHGGGWVDDRVALALTDDSAAAWRVIKETPRAGPLGTVPSLHVPGSGVEISQVTAVAGYINEAFGPGRASGSDAVAARATDAMLVSAAYLDIAGPLGALMWGPIRNKHTPVAESVNGFRQKLLHAVLPRLEALASAHGGPFFAEGDTPRIGDVYIFEALHRLAQAVGGDERGPGGADDESGEDVELALNGGPAAPIAAPYSAIPLGPNLTALCEAVAATPAVSGYIGKGRMASRISGAPCEPESLKALRRIWAAAAAEEAS